MAGIELITPAADSPYDEAMILAACQRQQVNAGHGEVFTGRPVTAVIDTGADVLKLRSEYRLPEEQARRFVEQAIRRERMLALHHPHKTWFLWTPAPESDSVVIGNITPHLLALNRTQELLEERSPEALVDLLGRVLDCYLGVLAQHELSLDLCLSNFGLDADDGLYYLDDDIYPGTNTSMLSDALGVLVRAQEWLDESLASRLGNGLRQSLGRHFNDQHWITVVAEGLRGVFIPPQCQGRAKALIDALYGERCFSYQAPPQGAGNVLALIADIHGNAPALECALNYLAGRGIDAGVMLGDVVGYGPHPRQCVAMLKDLPGWSMVRGNHDHAVACGQLRPGISKLAHWSLNWTIGQLGDEEREWLGRLPAYIQGEQWLAVHGSPRDKTFFNAYVYQMSYIENLDTLTERQIPLCFHGHTHIQKTWLRDRAGDRGCDDERQNLMQCAHTLICPGSIGQPRGGVAGVELAILDLATRELEFHRLPYDSERTIAEMQNHHFPAEMAHRLLRGL